MPITLLLACSPLPSADDAEELRAILDAELPALMDEVALPGAAVAVAVDGELAWSAGYGVADVTTGVLVDPAVTRFQAASISKTTAGWAALLAEEAGLVDLDAPVAPRTWSVPPSEHDPSAITLRRLLTHTAGTDVSGYPGWPELPPPSLVESLAGSVEPVTGVELAYPPGSRARYSGGGLSLAQLVIEETTGRAYGDWLDEALFEPGGLAPASATFDPAVFHGPDAAAPHDREGEPGARRWYAEHAASGWSVTAEALIAYALFVVSPPVPLADVAELTTDQEPPGGFGLGWVLGRHRGLRLAGHDGANAGGFRTLLWVAPETGDALVVLTNGPGGEIVREAVDEAWRGTL
ncbi:MAG: serine hydrolase domain-containing protein [Myxococcota bacterium]